MKRYFFGAVPAGAINKGDPAEIGQAESESSKTAAKSHSSKHHSTLNNLYHKLLGDNGSPVRGSFGQVQGESDEEFVRWDNSSSPLRGTKKSSPLSQRRSSPSRNINAIPASQGPVTEDPATELLSKFNSNQDSVLSTWPRRDPREEPIRAIKTESALPAITMARTSSKVDLPPRNLPQLYSPGYLKRSISFDRDNKKLKTGRSSTLKCSPGPAKDHVAQLLSLAQGITDTKEDISKHDSMEPSDYTRVHTAPNSPQPIALSSSPETLDSSPKQPSSPLIRASSNVEKAKSKSLGTFVISDEDESSASEDGWDLDELDKLMSQKQSSAPASVFVEKSPDNTAKKTNRLLLNNEPVPEAAPRKLGVQRSQTATTPKKPISADLGVSTSSNAKALPISFSDFESDSDSGLDIDELDKKMQSQPTGVDIKTLTKSFRQQMSISQPLTSTLNRPDVLRLLVTSIDEQANEVILNVIGEPPITCTSVILRQQWSHDIHVENGDIINVILHGSESPKGNSIVIDNKNNLMVVNPDILLTATAISDSVVCQRKVVLRERIRGIAGELSRPMLFGSIVHELFQDCLTTGDFSEDYLAQRVSALVTEVYLEQIVLVGLTAADAIALLKQDYLQRFGEWKQKYFSGTMSAISDAKSSSNQPLMSITQLLDIEQEIWSPVFGLKGKIDATVEADLKDASDSGRYIVPLELKTSKFTRSISHRAQTVLYTLLLTERYPAAKKQFGILSYIVIGDTLKVAVVWDEIRSLLIARNSLAAFSRHSVRQGYEGPFDSEALPAPISDDFLCKRCDWNEVCMVNQFAKEGNSAENIPVPDLFEAETMHLTTKHMDFYNHWNRLLGLEGSTLNMYRKQIWTMTSASREAGGSCFGNMKISHMLSEETLSTNSAGGNNKRFNYVMIGLAEDQKAERKLKFLESSFHNGDPIVISDEDGHVYLATGLLLNGASHQVTIEVNRRLDINKRYRIDKDELFAGMSLARANLVQLFVKSGDNRRRDFIVDLKKPRFLSTSPSYFLDKKESFNVDQTRAIEKVLRAEDYALILGMPGTGKTTTIKALIEILVKQHGKTVLIASHTHSAVDNILLKLDKSGMGVLRIGSPRKVHPDIQKYIPSTSVTDEKELYEAYFKPPIVAVTCMGINDWIFAKRTFDYCIIDEASQITLPHCIGPLRMAKKFILVGDHYQLPPLVKHPAAAEGGLDVSLFKHFCTAHPSAVVSLEHQYRMCEDIMMLSNKLVYDGRLKCGNSKVARQSLALANKDAIQTWKPSNMNPFYDWLGHCMNPENRVVFLNTDHIPGHETTTGDRIQNFFEAKIAKLLVDAFTYSGVSQTSIGVISQYKAQIRLLSETLAEHRNRGLEILTADRSQGRDKDCVIVSLVRSNATGNTGELLQDWRRLNVSFTRAKSKLIVIGSSETLESAVAVNEFLKLMKKNGWIFNIPKSGLEMYDVCMPSMSSSIVTSSKPKETKINYGKLLQNRPVLKEIINESVS